jgi:ribosomal protein S18 acetylase RimI-like enzyme
MAGFCNYRFVVEDDWVVLYVYELQVSEKHRRKGLGKGLLQLAEALRRRRLWTESA